MPGPPDQLNPHDIKRDIYEEVGNTHSKRLAPPLKFETINSHVGGVVGAWICVYVCVCVQVKQSIFSV